MRFSADDLHLFNEGRHFRLYDKLGAHLKADGVEFAVWAPNAEQVSVIGDFNGWQPGEHPMEPVGSSGIWATRVAGVGPGTCYKYHIRSRHNGHTVAKADPFGFRHETPPKTGSVVAELDHTWGDDDWMAHRRQASAHDRPVSIYEMHLGSWRRDCQHYGEIADALIPHLRDHGFTHVEFLPVMEHPFAGSWGYQTTGYFAPTSRFGGPTDFMALVDRLHQAGIGVILDWVPSHFPNDEHGLAYFDGTHLFEHSDPRQGFHPDWKSAVFNYGRHEVRSFLISNALFWLDRYHVDGLRVDAVASMLYLDYSRQEGEWIPNEHGGRENLEALSFLRQLNEAAYGEFPDIQTYAEESTAWPMVSRPTYLGGLGFGYKWDMGWMHDTLQYFQREPVHRSWHHNEYTFRSIYQFQENYVLPLSHDEVVHGKGSLIGKMPGDDWQRHANLRLLLASQWSQPGKKLLFMGGELAQGPEWDHDGELEWRRLDDHHGRGISRLVAELNRLYRAHPALFRYDVDERGYRWLVGDDHAQSVFAFERRGEDERDRVVVVINATPTVRHNYRIGVEHEGSWLEILNTDATDFGGSGTGNLGRVDTHPVAAHGHYHSLNLTLPPLAVLWLAPST